MAPCSDEDGGVQQPPLVSSADGIMFRVHPQAVEAHVVVAPAEDPEAVGDDSRDLDGTSASGEQVNSKPAGVGRKDHLNSKMVSCGLVMVPRKASK